MLNPAIVYSYWGISLVNKGKRERFNLSFSVALLRALRQIAHESKLMGENVGINDLMEAAVDSWLTHRTQSVSKIEQGISTQDPGSVIKCTHVDPIYPVIERILRSDQAEHFRAMTEYASSYIATHLETLPAEEQARAIEDLAEEIERGLGTIPSSETAGAASEPPALGKTDGTDRPRRKRAS